MNRGRWKRSNCRKFLSEAKRYCIDENGHFYQFVWKYVFVVCVATVLLLTALVIKLETDEDEVTGIQGENALYLWFLYSGSVFAFYVPSKLFSKGFALLLKGGLRGCGRVGNTVAFYLSAIEGAYAEVLTIAIAWNLDGVIFGIKLEERQWLDRTWRTLFALSTLNAARHLMEKFILARFERTSYERKVDSYLKYQMIVKGLTCPLLQDQVDARARDPEWKLETEESRLLDGTHSLIDKINYIDRTTFRLYDDKGELVPVRHKDQVRLLAQSAFVRLKQLPWETVAQATESIQKADARRMSGKASRYTVLAAYDVPDVVSEGSAESQAEAVLQRARSGSDVDRKVVIDNRPMKKRNSTGDLQSLHTNHSAMGRLTRRTNLSNIFGKSKSESFRRKDDKKVRLHVVPGELLRGHFFVVLGKDLAQDGVLLFDEAQNGLINFDEFVNGFFNAYAAYRSLDGSESCYISVSYVVYLIGVTLFFIAAAVTSLSIWNVPLGRIFVPLGTVVLITSFAISGTILRLVSSLMFVMGVRPYDVGDRVASASIYNHETLVVERIYILSTLFRRRTGKRFIMPNDILATVPIENHRRSPSATLIMRFSIGLNTDPEALTKLKQRILEYLLDNPNEWRPGLTFSSEMVNPGPLNTINLKVQVIHHLDWQESMEIWSAYSALLMFVALELQKLGITYEYPVTPYEILP
eukprot:gb/GECG01015023.1/.p1 GENE.gb/GECG01015023.1/~~gb/GECG01015023.1/.p1  ORF type:complete len:696 (+),score=53.99 gb/GECG01015023.1/:1-2088(+)